MKRDMGLIRDILLSMDSGGTKPLPDVANVHGHVGMLVDAGFVDRVVTQSVHEYTTPSGEVLSLTGPGRYHLTWKGLEFLEMIRPDEAWARIRAAAADAGLEVSEWLIRELVANEARGEAA